ncbi:hypothetical protein SO694_0017707 [Aureococcus anophagefferens]|uniref:Calcium-regulated actin-bundling protein C-terminal domain-containing protein n=1 Tax=Aureococcus anophagefferens TaxID=44056 RepID=A0ABR1FGR1_AURAN
MAAMEGKRRVSIHDPFDGNEDNNPYKVKGSRLRAHTQGDKFTELCNQDPRARRAADFLQKHGKTRTGIQRKHEIEDVDMNSDGQISFIEYLILHYKAMILKDSSQRAEAFADEKKKREAKIKELTAKAEKGGVKGMAAKQELVILESGDKTEMNRIELTLNAAKRKANKQSGEDALKKEKEKQAAELKKAAEAKKAKMKARMAMFEKKDERPRTPRAPNRRVRPRAPGLRNRATMGCCGPADVGRRKVLVALLANAGAAMNFSTIEIAVMLMGDAEGLTRGWEMSVLDSLVFAGCIIGMVSFGYVGDRVGRVKGLQAAMFLSVFGVVLSAATPMDTEAEVAAVLCVARFVLGVGIGGVYPLAAALAYERSDSDAVGELGARWRSMLLVGAVPFAWALLLADGLPKSDRPPAPPPAKAAGAAPKAGDAFLALLEEDRGFRVALGGAAAAWLGYNTYAYGIICYYRELESAILGDDVSAVLAAALLAGVAQFLAAVASVYHIRAAGSRRSFLLGGLGAAASFFALALYRLASDAATTALLVMFILLRGAIQWPGIAIYALPNTFAPPRVRARGPTASPRRSARSAPSPGPPPTALLTAFGLFPVFLISAVVAVLSCVGAYFVPYPRPKATRLEHEPAHRKGGAAEAR